MWKKKLTLILIPNASGILKQLSIPVATVYLAAAAVVILLLGSFFLSAELIGDKVSQTELESLRAENVELTDKFEQMRWHLAEVESRYEKLIDKEVKVRAVFDLPEIDPQERQLGIGGPTPPMLEQMTFAQSAAYATELELDRLLRLSKFEMEKYSEVETSLFDLKDRLDHTPSIWPCKGWLSRGYGMKFDPFTGYKRMHSGIDLANHTGTEIHATADGKVVKVAKMGGMGRMITIDHGYGFKTRYGHLSNYKVKVGQKVKRGDLIALMGSSGYSTGPHLHYEVLRNGKSLNPRNYILNEK